MRAWLVEACRINGTDWSAQGLLGDLATYVLIGTDDKDLGVAPREFCMPTAESMEAVMALITKFTGSPESHDSGSTG